MKSSVFNSINHFFVKKSSCCCLLALFLHFLPFELSAQAYFEVNGIRYRVIKEADEAHTYGTVSVAKPEFGEYEGNIIIPNVVKESEEQYADSYKVIEIDEKAFYGAEDLDSVILPVSLETIGDYAFCRSSLQSITIPTGKITKISEGAFTGTKIVSINIPSTVKRIEDAAFENCSELESVTFHDGLEYIDGEAFSGCIKLQSLSFPNTLKSIEDGAFFMCYRLNHVDVNENLKLIGGRAFAGCIRLRKLDLPVGLKEIYAEAFRYSGITEIIIPNTVSRIFRSCFGNSMLRNIQLPNKLKVLEMSAFDNCRLDNVTLPATLSVDSSKLKNLLLGFHEKQIVREKKLKNNYSKLNRWTVKCSELDISVHPTYRECYSDNGYSGFFVFLINGIAFTPIQYPTSQEEYGVLAVVEGSVATNSITIPDVIEVTEGHYVEKYIVCEIWCGAFYNQNVKEVVLPSTLEYIGPDAFKDCPHSKVIIPFQK